MFFGGFGYTPEDSQEVEAIRQKEFERNAEMYCRKVVHMEPPETTTSPLPPNTQEIEQLRDEIKSKAETSSYAFLLTRLSLHVCEGNEDALVFRPNPNSPTSQIDKPDLAACFAPYQATKKLVDNNWDFSALRDDEKDRFIHKVAVQETNSFVVCKPTKLAMVDRALRFLFVLSRHDPASCLQYGLVADTKGFQLVGLGLNEYGIWAEVLWDDEEWLGKLLACIETIISQARASLNPANEIIPKLHRTFPVKNNFIATYSATVNGREFTLLPLFYGRGISRKPFVALAVAVDDPKVIRVFKYSWSTSVHQGNERRILEQLCGVPGIVQIDAELSMENVGKEERFENRDEGGRMLGLLVLKTVGRPLSSCRSVREFLAAMFDLIEVLRNLDQRGIIHRDISWGNVLIPLEVPGTSNLLNKGNILKQAALPDVDPSTSESLATAQNTGGVITSIGSEADNRPNRFLSAVIGEKLNEPTVVLADFDHALNFKDSEAGLKDVVGTPMFMARDVLSRRSLVKMKYTGPELSLRWLTSLCKNYPELYGDNVNEKKKWDHFYSVALQDLEWITRERQPDREIKDQEDELAGTFKHQAVHDVESIFYICVLFFVRMWPKGAKIPESRKPELQRTRGELFRDLLKKRIGQSMVDFFHSLEFVVEGVDIPQMKDFEAMLDEMAYYISVPWYNVKNTGKGEAYEYHCHDALQRILLRRIKEMESQRDEILVEQNPLTMRIHRILSQTYSPHTTNFVMSVPSLSAHSTSSSAKRLRTSEDTKLSQDALTNGITGEKMINPVDKSPKWDVPNDLGSLGMFVDLAWEVAQPGAWLGL